MGLALAVASPVWAQGGGTWSFESNASIGEDYVVEVTGGVWNPTPDIVASSEQFGIIGSDIDFTRDLGLLKQRHSELRMGFKAGRRHKFRINYLPMKYQQQAVLQREIVFQGIRYDIGLPVDSSISWNTWRFGYEFDIIVRERGFLGVLLEAKYTDIQAELDSAVAFEYTRARAPIPALGAIGRMYITPRTPVTAEFTVFRLPNGLVEDYSARYVDFDIYGTVNLNKMVGVNVGYRSVDLSYLFDRDSGAMKLNGIYFSGVFRY